MQVPSIFVISTQYVLVELHDFADGYTRQRCIDVLLACVAFPMAEELVLIQIADALDRLRDEIFYACLRFGTALSIVDVDFDHHALHAFLVGLNGIEHGH